MLGSPNARVNIPRRAYISRIHQKKKRSLIPNHRMAVTFICVIFRGIFFGADMGVTVSFLKLAVISLGMILHVLIMLCRVTLCNITLITLCSTLTGEVFRIVIAKVGVLSLALRLYRYFFAKATIKCPPSSIIVQCFLTWSFLNFSWNFSWKYNFFIGELSN